MWGREWAADVLRPQMEESVVRDFMQAWPAVLPTSICEIVVQFAWTPPSEFSRRSEADVKENILLHAASRPESEVAEDVLTKNQCLILGYRVFTNQHIAAHSNTPQHIEGGRAYFDRGEGICLNCFFGWVGGGSHIAGAMSRGLNLSPDFLFRQA